VIALVAGILRRIADGLESEGARPAPAPIEVHIGHVIVEAGATADTADVTVRSAILNRLREVRQ
jgi:hypothetical protein